LPVLWKMPILPVTLAAIIVATIIAGRRLVFKEGQREFKLSLKMEIGLILAITVGAFLLRVPQLSTNPPGILVDEAYQGLQGAARWTGEKLPPVPEHETPPDYPFWSLIEALSTKTLGVSVSSIRLPAALIGSLSIPLAWLVVRSLLGGAAGLAAALFLFGSFWHVHNSRLALPLASLVAESLAMGWLLLAPNNLSKRWAPAAAGALAGYSIFGYSAALQLPLWGLLITAGRPVFHPEGRKSLYAPAVFALAFAGVVALISCFNPVTHQMGRTQSLFARAASGTNADRPPILAGFFSAQKTTNGQWANHPRGAPRLSPIERAVFVFGLAALFSPIPIPAGIRGAIFAWVCCAIMPEVIPGEIHLSRGIGALAPLAMIMGLAACLAASAWGKKGLALILVLGASNTAITAWHLYAQFPGDPQVKTWYQSIEYECASDIRQMYQIEPVRSMRGAFSYQFNPILALVMWNDIQDGHIRLEDNFPASDLLPLKKYYADPATGEPLLFILTGPRYPTDRRILPFSIIQLLSHGDDLENQGKLGEAESFYREMISVLPPSHFAQQKLDNLLYRRKSATPSF